MRKTFGMLIAGLLVVAGARGQDKGVEVKLDKLKSTTPAGWKEEQPTNTMRYAQFKVPKVEGDPADVELILFKLGGTAQQNVDRWKGQFIPPEGKKIDDVAKVTEFKVSGHAVTMLDISGTYLDGPPMLPPERKTKRPNYRMLAVQFEGPENSYQILMRGPAKTIEKNAKGFEEWIKAFK